MNTFIFNGKQYTYKQFIAYSIATHSGKMSGIPRFPHLYSAIEIVQRTQPLRVLSVRNVTQEDTQKCVNN